MLWASSASAASSSRRLRRACSPTATSTDPRGLAGDAGQIALARPPQRGGPGEDPVAERDRAAPRTVARAARARVGAARPARHVDSDRRQQRRPAGDERRRARPGRARPRRAGGNRPARHRQRHQSLGGIEQGIDARAILSVAATGFLIGALARLAIPGPDTMPFWLTILIGLGGAALGGGHRAVDRVGARPQEQRLLLDPARLRGGCRRPRRRLPAFRPEAADLRARSQAVPDPGRGDHAAAEAADGAGSARRAPGRPGCGRSGTRAERLAELDAQHERGEIGEEEYVERRKQVLREQS